MSRVSIFVVVFANVANAAVFRMEVAQTEDNGVGKQEHVYMWNGTQKWY